MYSFIGMAEVEDIDTVVTLSSAMVGTTDDEIMETIDLLAHYGITVETAKEDIDDTIYKRYVNNFFNFIFISKTLNSELKNNWLPEKLKILQDKEITCEYSKMIVQKVSKLSEEFERRGGDNYKDKLDLFFAREYKDVYVEYTKSALGDIINRISSYKKSIDDARISSMDD